MNAKLQRALARVWHWRLILASRFIGYPRAVYWRHDPIAQAHNELFAEILRMRVEQIAIKDALLAKGVIGRDRYEDALIEAAEKVEQLLESEFPGIRTTDYGLELTKQAEKTMKGWPA